jgi:hypothetical protein
MWNIHVPWFHLLLHTQSCIAIANPFELTNKAIQFNQNLNPELSTWFWSNILKFEVLILVTTTTISSSDIICTSGVVQAYQRFEGKYCSYIQCRRVSETKMHGKSRAYICSLLVRILFRLIKTIIMLLGNVYGLPSDCTALHLVELFIVNPISIFDHFAWTYRSLSLSVYCQYI